MKDLNERSYGEVLSEASDYFASQGVSIIGEGYKEIATNPALFESYVDQLTEGASADHAAEMAQIMVNTNQSILRESSMTGIQPVASLSMPVIRKLWPKFAIKEAIKTEVAKSPRFVVSYTKPYMFKGEEKIYLPKGVLGGADVHESLKKSYTGSHTVSLAAGEAKVVKFRFVNGESGAEDGAVVVSDSPSHVKVQPLDELIIVSAQVPASGTEGQAGYVAPVTVKIGKRLGVYGSQVYAFGAGQLLVQFDGKAGTATFAAIGTAASLSVKAAVSSEFNEDSWSVGLEIARQDVDIPTGKHLNAPMAIEALNDLQALYQIDGTKEIVDVMTNTFATKLDLEILDFIQDSLEKRPANEAFEGYGVGSDFIRSFDCKPAAGFAGSPKAWREELKPVIDYLAAKIKVETYLGAGLFSIVCNPIDAQILANVDWSFRAGSGSIDGVSVDYSVGTYVGAHAYRVISTPNVPQGVMYLVFTPSSETQMTYKHYAYSYSTEMGYVDPNRSRVPSLMMTARYTQFEFMPAVGAIQILNNDGMGYFVSHGSWNKGAAAASGTGEGQ